MSIQPSDYLSLSLDERQQLIDDIAASMAAEMGEGNLSPELAAELDRRVAAAEADPDAAINWEECKSRLRYRT